MNEKNDLLHSFNGIPYNEEVVPFPNFGAVVFQHNRELGGKLGLTNELFNWTFSDINNLILKFQTYFAELGIKKNDVIGLSLGNSPVEILMFFALMFKGIIIQPIFKEYSEEEVEKLFHNSEANFLFNINSNYKYKNLNSQIIDIIDNKKFVSEIEKYEKIEDDLPFVNLKQPTLRMLLKNIGIVEFNQYNLLASAQSIGKTFHLFRPGNAIINHTIRNLTDFIYSVFAPFYYGKTVKVDERISNKNILELMSDGEVHYSYFGVNYDVNELQKIDYNFINIIRDATVVINIANQKTSFKLSKKLPITKVYGDDISCGVGIIFDENDNWKCMDNIELVKVDKDGNPVLQSQNGELAFRGHTMFDKII